MFDCDDVLHFDCGCDEEFAARPSQRYCGCGQPMGYRDQQCDDCLDIALGEDLSAALDDHLGFEPLQVVKEFLAYAEASGAYKGESLAGLRGCATAYATRERGASDRYVRRMLDTGELVAEWHDNQRHLHDDACRCMDCCGAYL